MLCIFTPSIPAKLDTILIKKKPKNPTTIVWYHSSLSVSRHVKHLRLV